MGGNREGAPALRGTGLMRELDNPAWAALADAHRGFGAVHGLAARYAPDVSPMAAVAQRSARAYSDLAHLVCAGECVAVIDAGAPPARLWRLDAVVPLSQWICPGAVAPAASSVQWVELDSGHAEQMRSLAELTDPGPFERLTHALGDYIGVFEGGRLVAMAGERFCMTGFREVSAVCTHPDYAGRGYAQALVRELARRQQRRGCMPFLHVRTGSPCEAQARRVYANAGFAKRRDVAMAILERR